ncbi:unnamed protein product [Rhizophagus irregularis]|nr:unnamed protein product [Rhizophagus irregularis]
MKDYRHFLVEISNNETINFLLNCVYYKTKIYPLIYIKSLRFCFISLDSELSSADVHITSSSRSLCIL